MATPTKRSPSKTNPIATEGMFDVSVPVAGSWSVTICLKPRFDVWPSAKTVIWPVALEGISTLAVISPVESAIADVRADLDPAIPTATVSFGVKPPTAIFSVAPGSTVSEVTISLAGRERMILSLGTVGWDFVVVVVAATVVVVVVVVVDVDVVAGVVSIVTEVALEAAVGPALPAASVTDEASILAMTVPSVAQVTATVMLDPDAADGVKVQSFAVPVLLKSDAAMPVTDSPNASV